MRKVRVISVTIGAVLMLAACNTRRDQLAKVIRDTGNQLFQQQTINGLEFRLMYLPESKKLNGSESGELAFKLNVVNPDKKVKLGQGSDQASYGIDTLFELTYPGRAAVPIHAMRIANGNMNGVEYLVIFDKQDMPATGDCEFVFKDWLFTHQLIHFSVKPEAVKAADSLSVRI